MWELIIIISLAVIFFIFLRRMPEVERIGEEELSKKKEERPFDYGKKILSFFEELRIKNRKNNTQEKKFQDTSDIFSEAEEKMKYGDYAAAEKLYLKLITLEPKEASYYSSLGKIYSSQKNFTDAISSFKAAINRDKKNGFYYNDLGQAFFESGKYKEASLCFEKGVVINNKIPTRHIGFGLSLMKIGESKRAAESFRKAVEIEPNNQRYRELYRKALAKNEVLNSGKI